MTTRVECERCGESVADLPIAWHSHNKKCRKGEEQRVAAPPISPRSFRLGKIEVRDDQTDKPVSPLGLTMLLKVAIVSYTLGLLSPPVASLLYRIVRAIGE